MPLRVFIVEDDYLVREGTRAVLSTDPDIEVVGTASEPAEAEARLAAGDVDVVILDIRMPPTFSSEGIDLAHRLRAHYPDLGVVVLSQYDDPEYALELLAEGTDGIAYLLKERLGDAERLVGAVREVAAGGSMLDPKIVDVLLDAQRRRRRSPLTALTPRELEVLAAMATGMDNAAIADALVITERAVEKHTNAIFRKLGLTEVADINKRVAAVLFYLQRSRG